VFIRPWRIVEGTVSWRTEGGGDQGETPMAITMPFRTVSRASLGHWLLQLLLPGHTPRGRRSAAVKKERGTSTMPSPLSSMVQAFQSLTARQQELDRMELAAPPDERPRVEHWGEINLDALDHLQRAIAAVPAEDHESAVIQVLIALDRLSALRDRTEKRDFDDDFDVLQLLLRSALPALADAAGVDLAPYAGQRYARDGADYPFFTPRTTAARAAHPPDE
jgi:hypothetical protein